MFKLINNFYQNIKTNHKRNTSLIFNDDSNPILKKFSEIDDFVDITKDKSFEQNFKQGNNFSDCNKNHFLNEFAKNIFTTILDTRIDKDNNNIINFINSSDRINYFNDKSYIFELDDLFAYNDYITGKNNIQKFTIEFYLIKNLNNKKMNELVEKWKFSYKINYSTDLGNNLDINYLKNKIEILKKSIITYSKLFPLNQYFISNKNNNDYSINYRFYNNKTKKKGSFLNKPSGNVSLKNGNLFSFKMNIKYYSEKEIKQIFNETKEKYIDINSSNINKLKSLSFHKSKFIFNGFESLNIMKNNSNPINIDQKDNFESNNSKEIKTNQTEKGNDKIKNVGIFSDFSSFTLNIYDYNNEEDKNKYLVNEKMKENKIYENITKDNDENLCIRKCSIFSKSYETQECTPRNSESNINQNKEMKIVYNTFKKIIDKKKNNKQINNTLKEYNILKDMLQKFPTITNIKIKKLMTYLDVFE